MNNPLSSLFGSESTPDYPLPYPDPPPSPDPPMEYAVIIHQSKRYAIHIVGSLATAKKGLKTALRLGADEQKSFIARVEGYMKKQDYVFIKE